MVASTWQTYLNVVSEKEYLSDILVEDVEYLDSSTQHPELLSVPCPASQPSGACLSPHPHAQHRTAWGWGD
jgi:hypothetical protein